MYRITGKLKGLAPILFNRMLEDELEPTEKTIKRKGRVSTEDRLEEAHQKVYRNEKGLYVPGVNLKACLLNGCSMAGLKTGQKSLLPFLAASVFFDRELNFGKDEPDFIHEEAGRRPPKRGGRIIVRRPALNEGWELPFGLTVVDDRRTPAEIRRSLDEAGLLVGLGDHRPDYGRFIVIEWNVEQE